jgi:hypothetical protein
MGRIDCGGGDDGEPAGSPLGPPTIAGWTADRKSAVAFRPGCRRLQGGLRHPFPAVIKATYKI